MRARVTRFDVVATEEEFAEAQRVFERSVVPEMRKQPGYGGCYLMRTQRGKGLLISLWESDDPLRSSDADGPSARQLELLEPLLGRHPSTESYQLDYADHPTG